VKESAQVVPAGKENTEEVPNARTKNKTRVVLVERARATYRVLRSPTHKTPNSLLMAVKPDKGVKGKLGWIEAARREKKREGNLNGRESAGGCGWRRSTIKKCWSGGAENRGAVWEEKNSGNQGGTHSGETFAR